MHICQSIILFFFLKLQKNISKKLKTKLQRTLFVKQKNRDLQSYGKNS